MSTICREGKSKTFAALKLIEQLYLDHHIAETTYQNIIMAYSDPEDLMRFTGFRDGSLLEKGERERCTESII